ncbi:hypothetical protein [Kitasatospora sp. NPDC002965]|uniref:hypothetical protein n=1 Tax=Kitasatospora sp. NPDC002965 TaxID=3154775 RepID=UPI0033A50183
MPPLPILLSALGVPTAAAVLTAVALVHRRRTRTAPANLPPALPARPPCHPLPPRWYRGEYEAVLVVLSEGRLHIARFWANGLIEDCLLAFGEHHPYTRQASELLVAVVQAAIADIDRNALTAKQTGDPFNTVVHQPNGTAPADIPGASSGTGQR